MGFWVMDLSPRPVPRSPCGAGMGCLSPLVPSQMGRVLWAPGRDEEGKGIVVSTGGNGL